ncbi:ABC transporter ATP-binding protein [Marinicella sp. S1101]|uniref:ABC transporter ATP-binding protein n=1 Tax=Marinicella marina TaxID=2996016 RepID=UPI002260FCFE|nr:ABC transporter ATP-binding protein [Marinicella marina]MCX7553702.1 ABC transporter ATP-binding protein [Marinicella marina]MDJ1140792.1 ABC transporter ATP-binding protein [Marinicella marina]
MILGRVLTYGKGFRAQAIWASICSVVNKLFDIAPEILIGIAIDVVINQEDSFVANLGVVDPKHQLYLLGFLTFLIWAGESIFQYLYLRNWRELAQKIQHRFRVDCYAHIQQMDMRFFENQSTGRLTSILNDDVNQLERFLNIGANDILQVVTSVLAVGAVFFLLSPKLALLAFTPIPVIIFGAFYFQRKAEPRYAEVREKAGEIASAINTNIAGVATIKSFTKEQHEKQRISVISDEYVRANEAAIKISSAFTPVIRMAILTGFLATFIVGGLDTLNGDLAVGAYGVLVFLTQRLLWPFRDLANTMDLYERGMASARRILGLLDEPIHIKNHEDAQDIKLQGSISIKDLTFSYDAQSSPALKDINLEIKAGQTHAFVGQTGSGKSTIIKLLMRYYHAQQGRIELDSEPISNINISALRSQIGLVSQATFLFNASIFENIKYGNESATDEAVFEAAKQAEAHEFINKLDQGYDTTVGEAGVKLSGGQIQRIALARALLKNPQILILDEATSAVDNETEAAIQKSLKIIAEGRTIILIAHRLSTVVQADQIHVLEGGSICESGSHEELLKKHGRYAQLWQIQTGGG